MKASVVQSLLARNRDDIKRNEEWMNHFKTMSQIFLDLGETDRAYFQNKLYRERKIAVAKLVEIQKELKKELRDIYEFERMTEVF